MKKQRLQSAKQNKNNNLQEEQYSQQQFPPNFQQRPKSAFPIKQNFMMPNIYGNNPNQPPTNISDSQTTQQLSEQIMKLKNRNNELKDNNLKLKTKITTREKELKRYEKAFEDAQNTGILKTQQPGKQEQKSTYFLSQLKRQLKELELEFTMKEEELEKLKKNVKVTKLQEIEIEKKQFADEAARLKAYLDQTLQENYQVILQEQNYSSLEEQFYQQHNVLIQTQNYNEELKNQLQDIQIVGKTNQEKIQQLEQLIKQMKQNLTEKDEETQNLKNQYSTLMQYKTKPPQQQQFNKPPQKRIQSAKPKKDEEIDKQNEILKDQKLLELESQIQILDQKFQYEQQQQFIKQQEYEQLLKSYQEEKKAKLEENNTKNSFRQKFSEKTGQQIVMGSQEVTEDFNQSQLNEQLKEQLKFLGQEIKCKLLLNQIQPNDLQQYLFSNSQNQTTDFQALDQTFQSPPFQLDQSASTLLCAYLIQGSIPSQFDSINELTQTNYKILEHFFTIVGDYDLLQENQVIELMQRISQFLAQQKVQEYLSQTNQNEPLFGGYLDEILQLAHTKFSQNDINYFYAQLLGSSKKQSLLELQIADLFQDEGNYQQVSEIQEISSDEEKQGQTLQSYSGKQSAKKQIKQNEEMEEDIEEISEDKKYDDDNDFSEKEEEELVAEEIYEDF